VSWLLFSVFPRCSGRWVAAAVRSYAGEKQSVSYAVRCTRHLPLRWPGQRITATGVHAAYLGRAAAAASLCQPPSYMFDVGTRTAEARDEAD